jgi:hypothetical protein
VTRLGEFSPLGRFFTVENLRRNIHFWDTFVKSFIYYDKKGLGYILVDFFTNPSGHPVYVEKVLKHRSEKDVIKSTYHDVLALYLSLLLSQFFTLHL